MESKEHRIRDICEIIDGDRGKNYPSEGDFFENEYCLFLNAGNVTKEGWNFSDVHFITKEKDTILRKGKVFLDDIIMTTRGTVGNFTLFDTIVPYKNMRINSGMVIIRPNEKINKYFLLYLFKSDYVQTLIKLFCSGSAQPQLPIKDFNKIKLAIPPLPTQQKIASILSAYDNLIQNYKKQIEDLQTTASELYKEWFVRFRFPGYKTTQFENGIPVGWKVERIGNIGEVVGGGTPSTEIEEYWDGDIPWLSPVDLSDNINVYVSRGSKNITESGLKKSSAKMMPKDTVLLSSRAPVGYVALAKNPICTNQGFKSVVCNLTKIEPMYLYFYFKMNKNYLQSIASGATFPELSGSMMKKLKVLLPTMELQKKFSDKVNVLINKAELLSDEITILTQQRDLLLPRLMSGKLEVE